MRENLLGYLVGALDEEDHQHLERRLRDDESLRRELDNLRRRVEPLRADADHLPAPAGLADRTCGFVAAQSGATPSKVGEPLAAPAGQGRMADYVVAAGIMAASAMLFFPALMQSRTDSRLTACRNNLHEISMALFRYANHNGDFFPRIAADGPESAAGIYAVRLLDGGYLDSPRYFLCPACPLSQQAETFRVPSLTELRSAAPERRRELHATMGGSYGYSLGYIEKGKYHGTRNRHRKLFALAADRLNPDCSGSQSDNHGRCGQNVLTEDGRVEYVTSCRTKDCQDNFYRNDQGLVAAGLHEDDAVVGHSAAQPMPVLVGTP